MYIFPITVSKEEEEKQYQYREALFSLTQDGTILCSIATALVLYHLNAVIQPECYLYDVTKISHLGYLVYHAIKSVESNSYKPYKDHYFYTCLKPFTKEIHDIQSTGGFVPPLHKVTYFKTLEDLVTAPEDTYYYY